MVFCLVICAILTVDGLECTFFFLLTMYFLKNLPHFFLVITVHLFILAFGQLLGLPYHLG